VAIWQSPDATVALIDAKGNLTTLKAGTITLRVYFEDEFTKTVTIASAQ
jgi:hypothetical protein